MLGSHRIGDPARETTEYGFKQVKNHAVLTLMVVVILESVRTRISTPMKGRDSFLGDLLSKEYQRNCPLPHFCISIYLKACAGELEGACGKMNEEIYETTQEGETHETATSFVHTERL